MTETKTRVSRPAKIAAELESLGWTVETRKVDNVRKIRAAHSDGRVIRLQFTRTDSARDVLSLGEIVEYTERRTVGVAEALREAARGPDVPFALDDDAPVILAAVAGRTVVWRNRISGELDEALVPKGGMHLKIDQAHDGARALTFASADGTGFRSVRLEAIEKVS